MKQLDLFEQSEIDLFEHTETPYCTPSEMYHYWLHLKVGDVCSFEGNRVMVKAMTVAKNYVEYSFIPLSG